MFTVSPTGADVQTSGSSRAVMVANEVTVSWNKVITSDEDAVARFSTTSRAFTCAFSEIRVSAAAALRSGLIEPHHRKPILPQPLPVHHAVPGKGRRGAIGALHEAGIVTHISN